MIKIYRYIILIWVGVCILSFELKGMDFEKGVVGMSPAMTVTLAERKLVRIVEDQNKMMREIEERGDEFTENEKNRRAEVILKRYEEFIRENPGDIYAMILYGKLLKKVGLNKDAMHVFMDINKKDSTIGVVQQQLGNCLAEVGDYGLALGYFLRAIELEPKVALYYYQLGELLCNFRQSFIDKGILTVGEFDRQVLRAFKNAWEIEPGNWIYRVRYGESFYDIFNPDWAEALESWVGLEDKAPSIVEREMVLLNRGRVLIKLKRYEEARRCLGRVYCAHLEKSRQELLESI